MTKLTVKTFNAYSVFSCTEINKQNFQTIYYDASQTSDPILESITLANPK